MILVVWLTYYTQLTSLTVGQEALLAEMLPNMKERSMKDHLMNAYNNITMQSPLQQYKIIIIHILHNDISCILCIISALYLQFFNSI